MHQSSAEPCLLPVSLNIHFKVLKYKAGSRCKWVKFNLNLDLLQLNKKRRKVLNIIGSHSAHAHSGSQKLQSLCSFFSEVHIKNCYKVVQILTECCALSIFSILDELLPPCCSLPLASSTYYITGYDHRIIQVVWTLIWSLIQPPAQVRWATRSDQVTQSFILSGHENLKEWRFAQPISAICSLSSLWQSFSCLVSNSCSFKHNSHCTLPSNFLKQVPNSP